MRSGPRDHVEHLIKELVQNGMDAISDTAAGRGIVELSLAEEDSGQIRVVCRDNGAGVADLDKMSVLFWTSKQDSHLNRGRMGRGFKELLSCADSCRVASGNQVKRYFQDEQGNRRTVRETEVQPVVGTLVDMLLRWPGADVDDIVLYFRSFLPPEAIELRLNGQAVEHCRPALTIDARLTTEIYKTERSRWEKPVRSTTVELVPCQPGESPLIYEMGSVLAIERFLRLSDLNQSAKSILAAAISAGVERLSSASISCHRCRRSLQRHSGCTLTPFRR